MKRIRPLSAIGLAATTTLAAAVPLASGATTGIDPQTLTTSSQNTDTISSTSININIGHEDYTFNTINTEEDSDEGEYENLIHIPIRTRASVLRERNLQHLLQAEYEMDASEIFSNWASNNNNNDNNGRKLRSLDDGNMGENKNNNGHNHHRVLQEFSGEGTHFLDAYIGSPAQKRVLAVSGADFTAFPCEGCEMCGPIIGPYRQSESGSFIAMPCGRCVGGQRDDVCDTDREKCIARGYNLVDKSAWTAYEARDYIYVGGAEQDMKDLGLSTVEGSKMPEQFGFPLVFACQTEATGWYTSQVQDGIVGFSQARTSFVNQMVFQDQLKYPRFCMCFEQKVFMGDDYTSAGIVTLGGYNPHILDHPLVFVQNMEKEPGTRYKVHVRHIFFRKGGGQSVVPDREGQAMVRLDLDEVKFNEKNGGTILDSGVPLLILDESIQFSFLSEWKKMVGTDFTLGKMLLTEEEVKSLPTLIIQIKAHDGVDKSFNPRSVPNMAGDRDPKNPVDAMLAIPATHYMEYNPSTGTYRAKITLDSKLGSFIGIHAMMGHAFFYDLTKDRIGFAESYNCRPRAGLGGFVDDDMFELPTVHLETETKGPNRGPGSLPFDGGMPGPLADGEDDQPYRAGQCRTATCISFVTVGYCIVVIALAVAYKKWKPQDRSKQFDSDPVNEFDDNRFGDDETEVLNPQFEQHRMGGSGMSVAPSVAPSFVSRGGASAFA